MANRGSLVAGPSCTSSPELSALESHCPRNRPNAWPLPAAAESRVYRQQNGEPLANYNRVREAIRRMVEVMGISARSITVSTVGIVPGIKRLADEPWPVYLAISLHAADDELRTSLVPINKRYPLAMLEEAAAEYFEKKRRRLSIEWTMMDGVNDTEDQAFKLAAIARRLHAHVNLIALNPTPLTQEKASSESRIEKFASILKGEKVNVTIRDTRGQDIDAACGQLRVIAGNSRKSG